MTEDELAKMPQRTVEEILASIPRGPGYHYRTIAAVEAHANTEWWRGFYAGRAPWRHLHQMADKSSAQDG